MLNANPTFEIPLCNFASLKAASSKHLPDIPPSLRLEALARGLGYKTFNAFKSCNAEGKGRPLNGVLASDWLHEKGLEASPLSFHLAMSNYSTLEALSRWPDLNGSGLMVVVDGRKTPWLYGTRQSPRTDPEFQIERRNGFDELLNCEDEVIRGFALCSHFQKTKTECKNYGSYRAKHLAENVAYTLADGTHLDFSYVSNGAMIVAAIASGFHLYAGDHGRLNPSLNLSKRSINNLAKFDRREH